MVKKIILTPDKMSSLKGFEETLDLLDEPVDLHEAKGGITPDRGNDNYQLYNYLESEIERLNALDVFFTVKISNMENHSPTQQLIDLQRIKLEQTRQTLVSLLKNPSSPFMRRLEHLWNTAIAKDES
ncbi:MAG: hypothetical protein A2X86_02625 [Bdellovibrionales bacterium GWA2_49_15]|nr:MAG: hypothetical protein A2X86_02625 [Bdellovibrionales bacterium GWA2_49_15]HAZ14168.1 hypothetical protein [Bdellovibrionales bacterium]